MKRNLIIFLIISIGSWIIFEIFFLKDKIAPVTSKSYDNYLFIDFVDKDLNQKLIKLDTKIKNKELLLEKQLTSFPVTTYLAEEEKVYFTEELEDKSVQLFEKDKNSNKANKLTDNLNYVDFLQVNNSKKLVYMRVLLNNDRNFKIATFNLKTKELIVWNNEDNDLSVVNFEYNAENKTVLVVTKSMSEEYHNIDVANKKNVDPEPPDHKFSTYTEEGKLIKDNILILKKFVYSISSSDDRNILINFKDSIKPTANAKIAEFKVKENKVYNLIEDSDSMEKIRNPLFSKSKNGFYFLADKKNENSNDDNITSLVQYYDFKTKKIKTIWTKENINAVNIY